MRRTIIHGILLTAAIFAVASCKGTDKTASRIDWTPCWDCSQWISAADAPVVTGPANSTDNCRAADGSSWFVRKVSNKGKIVNAKWSSTALGVYDIYVNGVLVGDEILKPGFTHYAKTRLSFSYDVTALLSCGKGDVNVFSAQVTPGWWADKIITPAGHEGMIGKKCAFRSVLCLTYSDGSTETIGTDLSEWKAGIAGPVKHADIFDGEEYDAREPMGYDSLENLGTPELNAEFEGEIVPSNGAEVYFRNDLTLKPTRIYVYREIEGAGEDRYGKVRIEREYNAGSLIELKAGETLIADFGQNCSAVPSFIFKAAEGTVLECLPAEILNDGEGLMSRGADGAEGTVYRRNLRIPEYGMRLRYTFAGGGHFESFTPRCTFFGYRFVSLTASDDVTIQSMVSVPVSSITSKMETGYVITGSVPINQLISNTVWGQRSNYLSVPTDCPQRDERLGWTADTQVFCETGTFFADTRAFFHKWMRDMRDTQGRKGGFPGVAPKGQYGAEEHEMMRVGWSDAAIIVPWTIWKQFGDNEIVEENWEAMDRFIQHVNETKYDHVANYEENLNFQWGDWLSYEALEYCARKACGPDGIPYKETIEYWTYLSEAYWIMDAQMMADMAYATGRDAGPYEQMALDAKSYVKNRFLNADGTFKEPIFNTMQTPALFALKNGLVEGEALENMKERLRANFAEHGGCLQTGFLGTSILMQTLTDYGMQDVAYGLLFQRKNPGWLYSVDNGATTIWERWNSYTIESGIGPVEMNSYNHYAYGCVCQWIWETVCGIASDTSAPGFKHIIMKPVPDKRLGFVDAQYRSHSGIIKSNWEYEGDKWIWRFSIPEGSTASVTVPGENEAKEYKAGDYVISLNL